MTRVIKVGGRPQADASLVHALAAAHRVAPDSLVVVHGGGDEVSRLQQLHGAVSEFKGGRRVTSALDLEIIRMALSGSANKRLTSALVDRGVSAIGLSGEDAALLSATPLDRAQYGFVGVPANVNADLLRYLLAGGYMPVLSPVSRCADPTYGSTLNVNGDDAAMAIAIALKADELLFVSDVAGVLVHDESSESAALGFALSRVTQETHGGTPVGVFRNIVRPVYDELMAQQLETAVESRGAGDLAELLHSGETWTIS